MHMVKIRTWGDKGVSTDRMGKNRKGNNGIQGDGGYQNHTDGQWTNPRLTGGYFDKGK